MTDPTAIWNELATKAGLSLSPAQAAQLGRFLDLLLQANQTMNLTRITDRAAAEIQHVGDALTLLPYIPNQPCKIADVGSGGGVPGIPLAIVRPDITVTLIEATKKKAAFLQQAAQSLELSNVFVLAQRAEEVAQGELRESFDIALTRAVAVLEWLAEWCLPLVRLGGSMLAMKGPKFAEELAGAAFVIKKTGGGLLQCHPVSLPGAEGHVILSIPKISRADTRLPRLPTHAKGRSLR